MKVKNKMVQNLWDAVKTVLWGKFGAIQAYQEKLEKSQINNLTLHQKELENEQQKSKNSRRKEIINFRAEINNIEAKIIIKQINKIRKWLFEKSHWNW